MINRQIKLKVISNPLLKVWETPFATPPFDLIEISHFKPAVEEEIKSASEEINAITGNPDPPCFGNTIDYSVMEGRCS